MFSRGRLLLCLLVVLWTGSVFALDVPKLTGPVVDLAGVLSRDDQAKIAASILQFQQTYGPQLQVLVVPSLEDESLEGYSIKVVDKWKLGTKGKDDGVLLLVATESRKVRIEVGRGLEGDRGGDRGARGPRRGSKTPVVPCPTRPRAVGGRPLGVPGSGG